MSIHKCLYFLLFLALQAQSAVTDISSSPLVTASSTPVQLNLLFILDDSGSMAWEHMPDDAADAGSAVTFSYGYYGLRSHQCNGVYYNPAFNYLPPVDSSGNPYPNASFTAAWKDGYNTGAGTVNLSNNFKASPSGSSSGITGDTTGTAAYYYAYTGTQTSALQKKYTSTTSTFYNECHSANNTSPGRNVFNRVTVGASEQQNFANWYSYYRNRLLMMKTSAGQAFKTMSNQYRVGFMSLNNDSAFLNLNSFDSTQKSAWYTKLYARTASGSTPLKQALANAGKLYAGKLSLSGVSVADPVQYSCQQNFSILSTDGFWNDNSGGVKLDGTAVGDQDGRELRPMRDGNSTPNTLADIAEYYYSTDLRQASLVNCTGAQGSGIDVCENNVPSNGLDGASWQHMTSFTLGLGAPGRMIFSPSYLTDSSGDYFSVKNGISANSASGTCSWQSNGTVCNWPIPGVNSNGDGKIENIDDLWHAAVNGRGSYFSATNPSSLSTGLANALAGVTARTGSSAAATTSNPNVTSGDNFVFSSTFTTQEWDGELVRQQLDLTTGIVSNTIDWHAQSQLDAKVSASSDTRTIYTYDANASNHLKAFLWANLSTAEQAYFNQANIATLSQFCSNGTNCLSSTAQASAAGENLVNFLRGQRGNEGGLNDTSHYYRQRIHILGDIVNAEAVYVKRSLYTYADSGYDSFISANSSRQGMVYVAANDGMLHAFNADSGVESWAYIPSMLLPKLYKLADKNYATQHDYFVDGTPTQADVYFSGAWHTILVGGLNAGGRGYYALDITHPESPAVLWEFTDTHLGLSYGNPQIAKLKDGSWVVLVTSGYNNVSPGDGLGRLYILNVANGTLVRSISTGVGSTATPSGLARINTWVNNSMYDDTALRVYGGDLLGNLWRFDVNGDIGATGYDAQNLANLQDGGGRAQPITVKPELGNVYGQAVVYLGTGRYLGASDLSDTSQQSFYAIKDSLQASGYGNPRTYGHFIQQTETSTTCPSGTPSTICTLGQTVRTSSNNAVDFSTDNGWYIDLPDRGERANTDPTLAQGTLGFSTNIPNANACTAGGYSFRYFLDYRTGAYVSTSTTAVVSQKLGNTLATRPVFVRLPNNSLVELTRLSDGTTVTSNVPVNHNITATRRVSWRELIMDR